MALMFVPVSAYSQDHSLPLDQQLLAIPLDRLAADAVKLGDASRGAIVFHQHTMACATCHGTGNGQVVLGPDLAKYPADAVPKNVDLVQSVLQPSAVVRDQYKTVNVLLGDGRVETGTVVSQDANVLQLRTAASPGQPLWIRVASIEALKANDQSIMPAGQVNLLSGRQPFLDLIAYLIAIRDGGPSKAIQLQPPPQLLVAPPIAEYEKTIDHAGMIADLSDSSFQRGEAIYHRLCINCHGTKEQPGSLPTSLRFASGKFKNGNDPFAIYQTLTRGFGMMMPQTWMVPQQKYDVIHYIRQHYLKDDNPSQFFRVNDEYLASLPPGDSRGPAAVESQPWVNMNYGPSMINTFETGDDASNFAYKGIAFRLDQGPGGVSRGNAWMIFDHDTMRISAAWTQPNQATKNPFIDWQGIHFNGRHNIHPRVSGDIHLQNLNGPGWANPATDSFDDPRLVGRDGRKYGPLPNHWARLRGVYSYGSETVVDYQIGTTTVLESPTLITSSSGAVRFGRQFNLGPRQQPMTLQVASLSPSATLKPIDDGTGRSVDVVTSAPWSTSDRPFSFDGSSYAQCKSADRFDMRAGDFTVLARIKTKSDGAVFTKTTDQAKWVPGGKSLFIRGGRLTYDIGWVGAATSKKRVDDGKWHDIAMTWRTSGKVQFFVDGKHSGGGTLKPKHVPNDPVIRIGFTADNFPDEAFFDGQLNQLQFVGRALSLQQIGDWKPRETVDGAVAHWELDAADKSSASLVDRVGGHDLMSVVGPSTKKPPLVIASAGLSVDIAGAKWSKRDHGRLCLTIPAGDQPLRFVLWTRSSKPLVDEHADTISIGDPTPDLRKRMSGGPPRWPERLTTTVQRGEDDGPFAVDVLQVPASNPWSARVRLTGLDFADDDTMFVCSWDGDVWKVTGLAKLDQGNNDSAIQLHWQRVASGLFQPLGLKIVDGRVYVSCRDQICILNDLNGDGETDFYECFNRDHQVTDHFHEFAMGLQVDSDGNFYYAKSARHALKAVVPHHGTLLRVSKDGQRTDILANGFRAANGVCLNPDGTFIVTDQEGHWNPKNRINWVREGGFYGNMFGYHDVTDSSDSAMQPPLCWITNSFDRSPAELLWVDSEKWGPLNHRLLNLSYGYGKVYLVPHENVGDKSSDQKQGGMIELPIPQFPTGVIRGRFRPADEQLYLCGMFAWAGSQQQDGGLYRLRATGKPIYLPVELSATTDGIELQFTSELEVDSAQDPANYAVRVWSLRRTANYGSKHYDEQDLKVTAAHLAEDRKTVSLTIPKIAPTWCMEIRYQLKSSQQQSINGTIHNTIHQLNQPSTTTPQAIGR